MTRVLSRPAQLVCTRMRVSTIFLAASDSSFFFSLLVYHPHGGTEERREKEGESLEIRDFKFVPA